MDTYHKGTPEIQYPCRWVYKLFGTDQEKMREAVTQVIAGADYTLTLSRSSKNKKYHCMNLDVQVISEEDRTEIFKALSRQQAFVHIL
jgi:putative lipoic acid-binding regulatory protein